MKIKYYETVSLQYVQKHWESGIDSRLLFICFENHWLLWISQRCFQMNDPLYWIIVVIDLSALIHDHQNSYWHLQFQFSINLQNCYNWQAFPKPKEDEGKFREKVKTHSCFMFCCKSIQNDVISKCLGELLVKGFLLYRSNEEYWRQWGGTDQNFQCLFISNFFTCQ